MSGSGLKKGEVNNMNRSIEPSMIVSALVERRNQRPEPRFSHSMLLPDVAETMPARSSESGPFSHALRVVRRVFEQRRAALQGSRAPEFAPASIEQELSRFVAGFSSGKVRCEVSVTGHRRELTPKVQEQISLIGREALANALRHSGGTCIEAEIEYSGRRLRLVVRDNGRGINREAERSGKNGCWGLLGMRNRAESIGAKLAIWSKPGAGTEVEVSIPCQTLTDACA
jgi:signal transduction histidine kinase